MAMERTNERSHPIENGYLRIFREVADLVNTQVFQKVHRFKVCDKDNKQKESTTTTNKIREREMESDHHRGWIDLAVCHVARTPKTPETLAVVDRAARGGTPGLFPPRVTIEMRH